MSYDKVRNEVIAFLGICQEVQDRFERHSILFHGDVRCKIMEIADNNLTLSVKPMDRLFLFYHSISLENLVLQIGKLHDPNPKNFTIEHIWQKSKCYCSRLKRDLNFTDSAMAKKKKHFVTIKEELDKYYKCQFKDPRNNALAHSNPKTCGDFKLDNNVIMKDLYLDKLRKLCDILTEIWGIDKIENAGHDVKEEIEAFCKLLKSL